MAKWGKCDYRELQRLQKKLEKMQKAQIDRFCEEMAKELAARLLAKVINRTPKGDNQYENINVVDETGAKVTYKKGKNKGKVKQKKRLVKNGGTLIRGWTAETEAEAENGKGNGENPNIYANSLKVTKMGTSYVIIVKNPVHYASYVEYGHRQEPGRYVPAIGKRLKVSWVPGKFMLTISEKEINSMSESLLEKKLMQFLGECFEDG